MEKRSLLRRRPAKVTLVNLNLISVPAIAPYALDVLGTALADAGHEVRVLDLTREGNGAMEAIARHFAGEQPDLVALTMRNNNDLYFPSFGTKPDDGSFVPTHARVIDVIKRHVPVERLVVGGVGFSTAPVPVMRRFGVRYGVRGPGEGVLPRLATAAANGEPLERLSVPKEVHGELVLFDGRRDRVQGRVRRDFIDNAWYYQYGGLGNIRTSNGCGLRCAYCSDPYAKGPTFRSNGVEDVLYEIDQLVALGVYDLHTTDSEFNMPMKHVKSVLRGIVERRYPKNLRFWAYAQPAPWDEEYTRLLAAAGVAGVNIGTDHTDPDVLKSLNKWFTKEDIARTVAQCEEHGIAVMHELLFGYMGDTPDKMYRAIEYILSTDPRALGVTIGLAVTPGTTLADRFESARASGADLRGFYCSGEPYVNPVYYVDPAFDVPAIYDDLKRFLGADARHVMFPKPVRDRAGDDTDNQLVDSPRVEQQLLREQRKGAYWYHYGR